MACEQQTTEQETRSTGQTYASSHLTFWWSKPSKYKEEIIRKSKAEEKEVYELLNLMLEKITFINQEAISLGNLIHAHRLCADIDEKDTLFVALTLDLSGTYWTRDRTLREGLERKGFTAFFNE
ncbi:MAG: hypothetical protein H7319_16910 [Spirosoma sp.]|nr:hypothetical protein [Spirosoma sp.]